MSAWGMLDGELMPLDELCIPATDRGFLLGDAVFETMRTHGGHLFARQEHMQRLAGGLDALGIDSRCVPLVEDEAVRLVSHAVASAGGEFVARVTITRGSGPRGVSPVGAGPPRRVVSAQPLGPDAGPWLDVGIRVVTAKTRRVPLASQDPRIKTTSALNLVLARLEADAAAVDDALLCDFEGNYLEATAANLVVVSDERAYAPRGPDGVLEGVTLERVLRALGGLGCDVVRGPVPPDVVQRASEVWVTQTTRGLVPVVEIDGRPVASGRVGSLALEVRARMNAEVEAWLDEQ